MFRFFLLTVCLLCLSTISHGFAPNKSNTNKSNTMNHALFRPAQFVSAARPKAALPNLALRMSEDENNKQVETSKASTDGTFYDDEVDTTPVKDGISDSMKARLMKEAGTGLDSESKQDNVILYIILGVVVLVAAAGKDIFF